MNQLKQQLIILRTLNGWTKTEVAEKIGVKSLSTYANYEYGEREPKLDTLLKIADLYKVPIDYLVGRNHPPQNLENEDTIDFSLRLRTLRKAHGYTQEQVAIALHLTKLNYSYYETSKSEPDIKLIRNIARFYGVSIDYLLNNALPRNQTQLLPHELLILEYFNNHYKTLQVESIEQLKELLKGYSVFVEVNKRFNEDKDQQ